MKSKNASITYLFILAIFSACSLFSTRILDFTLVPRFIGLAIVLSIIVFLVYRSKVEFKVPYTTLLLLYVSFVGITCVSVVWANTRSESYFESAKHLLFFLVFFITGFVLKNDSVRFNSALNKLSLFVFFLLFAFFLFQITQIHSTYKESIYAITGINGHKNLLSSFLFLNLFFLIRNVIFSVGTKKMLPLLCIVLSVALLLFLKTKAVWLAMIVSSVIGGFLVVYRFDLKKKPGKNRVTLIVLLLAFFISIFFWFNFQTIIQKSLSFSQNSSKLSPANASNLRLEEERLVLWDKTYHMIRQRPLFGVGSGNWQVYFPDATLTGLWRAEDLNYTFQRPHNDFLWLIAETGFIGFNFFILFILYLLFYLFRSFRFMKENYLVSMDIILCASFIIGYNCISFFDFPKERIEHLVWINIILGIAYYHVTTYSDIKIQGFLVIKPSAVFICFLLCLSIVYIGLLRFNGEYHTRKMLDYKNSNQKIELIKEGNKALSFVYTLDPTSVPLQWYTGNAHAALGSYDQARTDFLRSYFLNPYNRNVLNDLGSSYALNGKIELAKKYYEESARISPRFDEPKLNLAALYLQESNFKMADNWLKSILHDSERRSNYQRIVDAQP